jgi:hypothetical protein
MKACCLGCLLLMLSGFVSASDKMVCRVTQDWHDSFGNYKRVEVCDFSNGDRMVTDCTANGCEVERTSAAERKAAEEKALECPNSCAGMFKMLPIPDVPENSPKKGNPPAHVSDNPPPLQVVKTGVNGQWPDGTPKSMSIEVLNTSDKEATIVEYHIIWKDKLGRVADEKNTEPTAAHESGRKTLRPGRRVLNSLIGTCCIRMTRSQSKS